MAMHQPDPRVIGSKAQDEPSIRRQYHDVPPRGVFQRQVRGARVSRVGAASEDKRVVAVEVDGVRLDGQLRRQVARLASYIVVGRLDDDVDHGQGLVEIYDVLRVCKGGVALDDPLDA